MQPLDIATALRSARIGAGFSQAELAARAGTSQAAVSDIERGRRQPTAERFERLLQACGQRLAIATPAPPLGVEPDHLLLLRENAARSPAERLSQLAPFFGLKGLAWPRTRRAGNWAGDVIARVDLPTVQLDPTAMLTALAESGVECVVVGGVAAILRGDIMTTADADIVVRKSPENLLRLASLLDDLEARVLVAVNDLEVATVRTAELAELVGAYRSVQFLTRHGILDVDTRGFARWATGATARCLSNGAEVLVASLNDLIASKAKANEPKDQYALARLKALREGAAKKDPEAD